MSLTARESGLLKLGQGGFDKKVDRKLAKAAKKRAQAELRAHDWLLRKRTEGVMERQAELRKTVQGLGSLQGRPAPAPRAPDPRGLPVGTLADLKRLRLQQLIRDSDDPELKADARRTLGTLTEFDRQQSAWPKPKRSRQDSR